MAIEARRGESRTDQIDRLLGKSRQAGPDEKYCGPGNGVGEADFCCAGVDAPAGQAAFEARVRKHVDETDRQRQIILWIGRIDRGAGPPLPADEVHRAKVIAGPAQELGLRPIGIHHRAADRVQIKRRDVRLPVENVGKRSVAPKDQLAAAAGMQIVVVAEKAAMVVVADVDVIARLAPEDIVVQLRSA